MTTVWILWHISHAVYRDGTFNPHSDADGDLTWDEKEGDDLKILGVFSRRAGGLAAIGKARELPGFTEEPNCFRLEEHELDKEKWSEGFARLYPDDAEVALPEAWERLAAAAKVLVEPGSSK
jgi:hypothetical protein